MLGLPFMLTTLKTGNIHDNYLLNDIFNTILIKWFHFLSFDIYYIVNAYEQFNSVAVTIWNFIIFSILIVDIRQTTCGLVTYYYAPLNACWIATISINICDESYDVDLKRKRFVYSFFSHLNNVCIEKSYALLLWT